MEERELDDAISYRLALRPAAQPRPAEEQEMETELV